MVNFSSFFSFCFTGTCATGSAGPAVDHPRVALHHDDHQAQRGGERHDARLEIRRHGRRPRLPHHLHALHHHRHSHGAAQRAAHHRQLTPAAAAATPVPKEKEIPKKKIK